MDILNQFDELFGEESASVSTATEEKPDILKQFDELEKNPDYQSAAYKVADMLTNHPANKAYASAVARYTPAEQQEALIDAVYELGSKKKHVSSQGIVSKSLDAFYAGLMDLGETGFRTIGASGPVGLAETEEQKKFAHRLKIAWEKSDPLKNPDASWYNPSEAIISASEMAPSLIAAGGAGKAAAGAAKLAGLGTKAASVVGQIGSAASFAPGIYEDTYDSLLESGVSPSTARWASATSAGLQSAIFAGLPSKLLPKGWKPDVISKKIGEGVAKHYAKTALIYGPSVMAGSEAINEVITDIAKDESPDVAKYIKNAGETYIKSIGPMAIMAAPGAIAGEGAAGPGIEINLETIKKERINKEILEYAEKQSAPSRDKWKEWGLKGGRSREDRYIQIQKMAKDLAKEQTVVPKEAPEIEVESKPTEEPYAPEQIVTKKIPEQQIEEQKIISEENTTSIKNEIVNKLREEKNLEKVPSGEPEKVVDWFNKAEEKIKNDPEYTNKLINELKEKPRSIDKDEVAALQIKKRELENSFNQSSEKLFEARKSGDVQSIDLAQTESNDLLNKLNELDLVTKKVGTEWGQSGVARKVELMEDYSIGAMVRKARVAKGGEELTKEEGTKVKELSDKITELQSKLNKYIETGEKPLKKGFVKSTVKREAARKKVDAAWEEFKSVLAGTKKEPIIKGEQAALNVDVVESAVKLAKAYADLGVAHVSEFLDNAKGVLGEEFEKHKESLVAAWKKHESSELEKYKKGLRTRLSTIEEKIQNRDFTRKEKKERVSDKEAVDLKYQIEEAKRKFVNMEDAFKKSQLKGTAKILNTASEVSNATRAVMTSFDMSALLRQGGFVAFGHPVLAAKTQPKAFKALASKKGEYEVMDEIRNRPNAQLYSKSKLAITETEGKLSNQEEAYMGKLSKKIPGVAASERAYVTTLNLLRADLFDVLINDISKGGLLRKSGTATDYEAKIIADYVNNATGRGNFGQFNNSADFLATYFFSPRYLKSRFDLLLGTPMWKGTSRTRLLIAKEYARTLAGIGAFYASVMATSKMFGDKEPSIEFNPLSSDFGKIRMGNLRLDPLAGLSQITTFTARNVLGKTKVSTGEIIPIRGEGVPFKGMTVPDVWQKFLRTKLAPIPGTAIDIVSGENVVGEPVTPVSAVARNITPLSFKDIYEALQAEGVDRKVALPILVIFGMSLQNYENAKPENFAFKIAQHQDLKGINKKTKKIYNHSGEVSQIVNHAKKLGISENAMKVGLIKKLKGLGYTSDVISKWTDRLHKRYNVPIKSK